MFYHKMSEYHNKNSVNSREYIENTNSHENFANAIFFLIRNKQGQPNIRFNGNAKKVYLELG